MTTNSRIRQIAPNVVGEVIAEQTHIFYDAATQSGSASFQSRENLYIDGVHQPLTGDFDVLQADLAQIGTRCFVADGVLDPVTQAPLSQFSAAGVSEWLKACFDVLHNERAAARAAAAAASEPAA